MPNERRHTVGLSLHLPGPDYQLLDEVAKSESRDPRQQAQHFVIQALEAIRQAKAQ